MDTRLVRELRNSIKDCTNRGLVVAAKWSSELYLSIPQHKRDALSDPGLAFSASTPARSREPRPSLPFVSASPAVTAGLDIPGISEGYLTSSEQCAGQTREVELERSEEAFLLAAQSFVASKEFGRALHVLRNCQSLNARFLSIYCQFLISEKKTERNWCKHHNVRGQPPIPFNQSLLDHLELVKDATDPWLLFLKSIFLSRLNRREEAIEGLISSIGGYPWNWSAWTLLGRCIGDGEELSSLLPLLPLTQSHPLVQMFQIRTMNELNSPTENELAMCDRLLGDDFFRGSAWVMSLRACVLYHLHDFGQAEKQFEKILAISPYRVDDIDVYSNILYVTENRLKLSRLAHEFLELDKDRPEVCCLVGNHYSLRAEHEKAVKYFRRATELDRTYLSAWTLMGHEYVEMKNSHAAIEAYRRAVDVNRKDYRAWYGLGQAYELLSMHQYALHYYQRATALRPYDVRLWQAQASCYEEIGRTRDAVECLKRALLGADRHEVTINSKLAKLHEELEEPAEAVAYHRRVVDICGIEERPIQDYAKSSIYVARYQMVTPGGDLLLAKEYLEQVANSNAEEVTQAADWLKKLKSVLLTRPPVATGS
ncbi:TPR-like protein [Paxillus ammoniavirescens]|nr:TPR-like protein [Paxillus ammoniavirescens]